MDISQHGEEAYSTGEGAILILPDRRRVLRRRRRIIRWRGRHEARSRHHPSGRLNDVLEELYRAEVQGLSISRVHGHGGERESVETYRGTTVKMELVRESPARNRRLQPLRGATVQAILDGAHTGDVGDGKIFVLPVEKVYRIRTREEDRPPSPRSACPRVRERDDRAWQDGRPSGAARGAGDDVFVRVTREARSQRVAGATGADGSSPDRLPRNARAPRSFAPSCAGILRCASSAPRRELVHRPDSVPRGRRRIPQPRPF